MTTVTLDVSSGLVLAEDFDEGGDEWPPPYQALADSLAALYSDVAPPGRSASDVFESGLEWPTVRGPGFILLQKKYWNVDHDIWIYHLDRTEAVRVLALPNSPGTIAGGAVLGSGILFAAESSDDTVSLYWWREQQLDTLRSFAASRQQARVLVRGRDSQRIWFILQLHPTYERGDNPVFVFDGRYLRSVTNRYSETYDFDIHTPSQRYAIAYWSGSERHVTVHQLSEP